MRLLDLFCGAGGAAMGYHRAGFEEIVGVDLFPQPHYPFVFVQRDALEFVAEYGHDFDVIHASPPCQAYSRCRTMHTCRENEYPDLVEATLETLQESGKPFVLENVPGAPFGNLGVVELCGLSFGLKLFRHRRFASNLLLFAPEHLAHRGRRVGEQGMVSMVGHGDSGRGRIPWSHRSAEAWKKASGINGMTMAEMAQAIPPAYTEFLGRQLLRQLKGTENGGPLTAPPK